MVKDIIERVMEGKDDLVVLITHYLIINNSFH